MSGDLSIFELWDILTGSSKAWEKWARHQAKKETKHIEDSRPKT